MGTRTTGALQPLIQGIAALAHLSGAKAFALMTDMIPEEPYEPKSWKDAMSDNGREK